MINKQDKNKIDWTDYTWNPISGCLHNCSYCYLKRINGFDMTPRFHENRLKDIDSIKESSKIFVGSSADCFGEWVSKNWIEKILQVVKKHPEHTFQFLTKNPKRYLEWDWTEYKNVWIGTTIDTQNRAKNLEYLKQAKANIKFVSFEPLLEEVDVDLTGIDWIIIGADSNYNAKRPLNCWAANLIMKAFHLGIPVWVKDNFKYPVRYKQFPEIKEVERKPIQYAGKYVGHIKGDTYYTSRDNTNIFRKYNSVNISQAVIEEVKQEGATRVEIKVKQNDKEEVIKKSVAQIENNCSRYKHESDWQYVIPLEELKHSGRTNTLDFYFSENVKEAI